MKNKDNRFADDSTINDSTLTGWKKLKTIIDNTISETCEKSNRQMAALRLEVNDLSKRLSAKDNEILALKEEVATLKRICDQFTVVINNLVLKDLKEKEKTIRKEKAYHTFFSGDNGLLYRLGHILSNFSQLSLKEKPTANDLLRAISPFINLANNLSMLDSSLTKIAQDAMTVPDIPIEQLSLSPDTENEENFYTTLWQVCEAPLRRLCDQNRDEKFDEPGAYEALMADVKELLTNLQSCDIAVIPAPEDGFDTYFDNSKTEATPSRPLVMRVSNHYVYTRGLYNSLKPYTPW